MTISQKQSKYQSYSHVYPLTVQLDLEPETGNILIAAISSYDATGQPSVFMMSQFGVGWGRVEQKQSDDEHSSVEIWLGIVSGYKSKVAKEVTIHANSTSTGSVHIFEYEGLSSRVDVSNRNNGYSTITNTNTITTNNANDLLVGAVFVLNSAQNYLAGDFTPYVGTLDASNNSLAYLEKIVDSTQQSVSAGTSCAAGDRDWLACIAAFKAAESSPEYTKATIDNIIKINAPTQGKSADVYGDSIDVYGSQGMAGPVLNVSQAMKVESDILTYGVVMTNSDPMKGSGGGAVLIGHGFMGPTDHPKINLTSTIGNGQGAQAVITVVKDVTNDQGEVIKKGVIDAVSVTSQGNNYNFADIVVVSGSGAILSTVIDGNNQISDINVVSGGTNYTSNDKVIIYGDGTDAAATLVIDDGVITDVVITNPGSGYTKADAKVGGSGARLVPIIANETIERIAICDGGENYSTSNTITITNEPHDTLYLVKTTSVWPAETAPADLDLGNLAATQLQVKSTNSVFAVTAGDNGPDEDTYLVPQNPPGESAGLGLGTAAYPFKWVDATTVCTNEINSLDAGGILLYKPLGYPLTAGVAISANRIVAMSADNIVVMANRSNAQRQVGVAVADISQTEQGIVAFSGPVQVRAGMALTAGMHVTTDDYGRAYQYTGHNHDKGTLTLSSSAVGSHNHGAGANLYASDYMDAGKHSHSIGEHTHGAGENLYASDYGSAGSHTHTVAHPHTGSVTINSASPSTSSAGAHSHSVSYGSGNASTGSGSGGTTGSSGGSHSHSYGDYYAQSPTGGADGWAGWHSHAVSQGEAARTTGSTNITHSHSETAHTHSYTYYYPTGTSSEYSHTHTVAHPHIGSVTIDSASPVTSENGVHNHVCGGYTGGIYNSGNTSENGVHNHVCGGYTGDMWTGAGGIGNGSHTHTLTEGFTGTVSDEKPIGVVIVGANTDGLATILLGA